MIMNQYAFSLGVESAHLNTIISYHISLMKVIVGHILANLPWDI